MRLRKAASTITRATSIPSVRWGPCADNFVVTIIDHTLSHSMNYLQEVAHIH